MAGVTAVTFKGRPVVYAVVGKARALVLTGSCGSLCRHRHGGKHYLEEACQLVGDYGLRRAGERCSGMCGYCSQEQREWQVC